MITHCRYELFRLNESAQRDHQNMTAIHDNIWYIRTKCKSNAIDVTHGPDPLFHMSFLYLVTLCDSLYRSLSLSLSWHISIHVQINTLWILEHIMKAIKTIAFCDPLKHAQFPQNPLVAILNSRRHIFNRNHIYLN